MSKDKSGAETDSAKDASKALGDSLHSPLCNMCECAINTHIGHIGFELITMANES